jgi:hypothetical protein
VGLLTSTGRRVSVLGAGAGLAGAAAAAAAFVLPVLDAAAAAGLGTRDGAGVEATSVVAGGSRRSCPPDARCDAHSSV